MTKKKIASLLMIFLIIFSFFILNVSNYQGQKNKIIEIENKSDLRKADFWRIGPIEIDDDDPTKNWAITEATYDWCKGSGTWGDPYVIENVTIDGMGGTSIEIRNSNVFFIIRNCTFINYTIGFYAIETFYVNNSLIYKNNFSDTYAGIFLRYSNNNTFLENEIKTDYQHHNHGNLIYLASSNYNNITNNNLENTNNKGIYLTQNSDYNIIINNILTNIDNGIMVVDWNCDYNNLTDNILNNSNGIYITGSHNLICNNSITNGRYHGICISGSSHTITGNNMSGCGFHISFPFHQSNFIDHTNLVNGKYFYYYKGQVSLSSINFTNAAQIALESCSDSIIENFDLSSSSVGVSLYECNNITVSRINSSNNYIGIELEDSDNNTIFKNDMINTFNGIRSIGDYNNISDNLMNEINNGILLNGDYNNISNNIILKSCGKALLLYSNSEHNIIYSNDIINPIERHWNGISIEDECYNNTILKNRIANSRYGIVLGGYCDFNNITQNNISDCVYGFHIYYLNSFNNTISNNRMSNCGFYIFGNVKLLSSGSIDPTNLINEKHFYLYCSEKNLIPDDFSNAGQIILVSCNDSIISEVNTSKASIGIWLYNSHNNTISGVDSTDNYPYGLHLIESDNNVIKRSRINYNTEGINLVLSDYNNFSNNYILNNSIGIHLINGNNHNTIYRNTICNNTYGVYILNFTTTCANNLCYNNTFHNSKGKNAYDNGENTRWDNGLIGNYWSNYSGYDLDDNGIGDIPYYIPGLAGSMDNYPIWDDGDDILPIILINSPLPDEIYGKMPPDFNIRVIELNLDTLWYTIDGGITNSTFTSNGTINVNLWSDAQEGLITIIFYANDTAGNIGFVSVLITKKTPSKATILGFNTFWLIGAILGVNLTLIRKLRKKNLS